MTNEQAKKMLKAKLECLKRETSGTDFDCNNSNCDECSLCYEQGNMGEQKEALDMAIKALEQQPCGDCISRETARRIVDSGRTRQQMIDMILATPPVIPQPKIGRWIFVDKAKEHAHCSECDYGDVDLFNGRPHNYCPNCGAKMESEERNDS